MYGCIHVFRGHLIRERDEGKWHAWDYQLMCTHAANQLICMLLHEDSSGFFYCRLCIAVKYEKSNQIRVKMKDIYAAYFESFM